MQWVKHLNICAERLVELEIVEFGWFGALGSVEEQVKVTVYKEKKNKS